MDQKITLVINRICPFAHRAFITLYQKKVPFELLQVSLKNKEARFSQIYKTAFAADPKSDGKVPILIHGDKVLAQSDLITWYLAETFSTGTQLIPSDTFLRAKVRYFSQTYPSKFFSAFYGFAGYNKKAQKDQIQIRAKLDKVLAELQEFIVGPYIVGEQFTVADILLYPWFERWTVIEDYLKISIDEKYVKVLNWVNNMKKRDSIKATKEPRELYTDGYLEYFA